MKRLRSTMLTVVGCIGPAALMTVVLQQYGLIGVDTALLLGLLYLIFISTHVWCKIFTKIPTAQSSHLQVDALPCYEDAIKSEPPPYNVLYPNHPPLGCVDLDPSTFASRPTDETTRVEIMTPIASATTFFSTAPSTSTPSSFVNYNRDPMDLEEESLDSMPILERSRQASTPLVVAPFARRPRRHSCPASQAFLSPPAFELPLPSNNGPSLTTPLASDVSPSEEQSREERFYKHFLDNIGNPVDYV